MKVLEISKYYPPHIGGIEVVAEGVSQGLVDNGHEVLVCTSDVPRMGYDPINLYKPLVIRHVCLANIFNTVFCPGMLTTLLKERYDVVHLHLPDPFGNLMVLAAQYVVPKPLVVTYHADVIRGSWYHKLFMLLYRPFLDRLLDKASIITTTTMHYAKTSEVLAPKYLKKIRVVPNFVDVQKHKLTPTKRGDKKRVLFVGRLVPYKGLKVLLDAVKPLDIELNIVGNGPLYDELVKYAMNKGIGVVFHTNAPDLNEDYDWCDVLVLPSVTRQEAFGIVLVEAFAHGKPVVASDIGGVRDVVRDKGYLVKPGDADDLRIALNGMLVWGVGSNPDELRKYAIDNFSKEVVVKSYMEVLQDAISMGNPK